MNAALALRIEQRVCQSKRKCGWQTARSIAQRKRAEGVKVDPYRCPFCGSWHVGRPPSQRTLERIALAIRARGGNAP